MPNRILRDWTDSFAINALDAQAERFFVRLIMKADDFGRFHADPRLLKSYLFPLVPDTRETDCSRWLAACEKAGLLRCYVDDRGRNYLEIVNFKQRTRQSESKFPSPDSQPNDNRQNLDRQLTVKRQSNARQLRTETETETETETNSETLLRANESPPFQADFAVETPQPPQQAEIDALSDRLRQIYKITGAAGWKLDGTVSSLAIELHAMSATPAEVESFWNYRTKKPAPQYFAQDFLAWRAQAPTATDFEQIKAKKIAAAQKALEEMDAKYGKRAIA